MALNDHLSLGKIAKLCNVSRTTAYRWVDNGQLKAYALPSGHFRVRPDDLSEFCAAYQIPDPFVGNPSDQADEPVGGLLAGPGSQPSPPPLKVLIADDHPDMVDVLERVVQRYVEHAEIHVARNGVETCMMVATLRPDILLLDIMMPAMDGFQVLRELLNHDELDQGAVVVVSAYDPFDRVLALEARHEQVKACYRKPVSIEELGGTLRALAKEVASGSRV